MQDKPRILVVDQDPRGCSEIQQLLATSPFIVVGGVGYDEEAINLASELKPQIIFVALPEHDELTAEALREFANLLPQTPIVTYSSRNEALSAPQARALGAREHLTKPLSQDELTACIGRALDGVTEHAGSDEAPLPDRPGGSILTVFGPKGGIGRTLVAVNLAVSMAEAGLKTALVDLDSASGDVARRMKIRVDRGLLETAQRSAELDESAVESYLVQHASGVKVLPAPREPTDWREIDPEAIDGVLTLLAKVHDFVIIDTPATFTDLSILAVHRADAVVLLSSLDRSSVETTAIALEMLSSSESGAAKTRLTLNHLTPAKSTVDADAAGELVEMCWWSLPYDEGIACRDEAGRPAVISNPKAKISRSISKMAALLAEARLPASGAGLRSNGPNLLSRVLGRKRNRPD